MANKLLIIGGQSNAIGLCIAANVNNYAGLTSAYPAVQLTDHNVMTLTGSPSFIDEGPRDLIARVLFENGYSTGQCGVELVMGRELTTRSGDTWHIGKMAFSGASMLHHLDAPHWPDTFPPTARDQFITFIQSQITAAGVVNPATDVVIVWIQGESDFIEVQAGRETGADYLGLLQDFFGVIRTAVGNVAVVLNRLHSSVDTLGGIRTAQQTFANTASKVSIIYNDDLSLRDTYHFVDNAYTTLALRFTDAVMLALYATITINPDPEEAAAMARAALIALNLNPWTFDGSQGDRSDEFLAYINEHSTALDTHEATAMTRLLSIGPAAAKSATAVHALYDNTSAAFPGPFTNPDVPRNVRVTMSTSWDGGDVTVVGTDQFDAAQTETFTAGSNVVRVGTKIFKTVTSASKSIPAGVGGNGASIGTGDTLGVPAHLFDTVGLAYVGTTIEAVTLSASANSAIFTTTPSATTYILSANCKIGA